MWCHFTPDIDTIYGSMDRPHPKNCDNHRQGDKQTDLINRVKREWGGWTQ